MKSRRKKQFWSFTYKLSVCANQKARLRSRLPYKDRPMSAMIRALKPILAECVSPTEIRHGKKHLKIFVGGRMCSVISHQTSSSSPNALRNVIADIRRADRA